MDEWEAVSLLSDILGTGKSDDCSVLSLGSEKIVISTDMLHRKTDLPEDLYPEVIGWRAMAVTLSDIGAMGAKPEGLLLALGTPEFEPDFISEVAKGAKGACEEVGAEYLGGDLDSHDELTLVSTGIGLTQESEPVKRSGARKGDVVCVTGELGRTAVGLRMFEKGKIERANELFKFDPRVVEGVALSEHATAMMDISDGLAVSLHQLSEMSGVGFEIESKDIPVMGEVESLDEAVFVGEDYELVFTLPPEKLEDIGSKVEDGEEISVIGRCVESGVRMDGDKLAKEGYQHS